MSTVEKNSIILQTNDQQLEFSIADLPNSIEIAGYKMDIRNLDHDIRMESFPALVDKVTSLTARVKNVSPLGQPGQILTSVADVAFEGARSGVEVVGSTKTTFYNVLVKNPEAWKAKLAKSGNLRGVVYENGHITEHVELQEVEVEVPELKQLGPDIMKATKALGTQILLVDIAMKLREVNAKLDTALVGMHNDRCSEVRTGLQLLQGACTMEDRGQRDLALQNTIPELTRGINKLASSLATQIQDCPKAETGFFDGWISSGLDDAKTKMSLAQESIYLILGGLQGLYLCYSMLSSKETKAALTSVKQTLSDLLRINLVEAHQKIGLIYSAKDEFGRNFWKNIIRNLHDAKDRIEKMCLAMEDESLELSIIDTDGVEYAVQKM